MLEIRQITRTCPSPDCFKFIILHFFLYDSKDHQLAEASLQREIFVKFSKVSLDL